MANDGRWIASPGPYQDFAKSLSSADPRLIRQDSKATLWSTRPAKLHFLDLHEQNEAKTSVVFETAEAVREHFKCQLEKSSHGRRTLYILEGGNADFATLIGSYFKLHPSIFAEYQCVVNVTAQTRGNETLLPSVWANRQCCTLRYRELVELPVDIGEVYGLQCPITGRNINNARINGKFNNVGSAQRKCIRWVSEKRADDGWDYLLICDPPLRRIKKRAWIDNNTAEEVALPGKPFQGGYVDFIPEDIQIDCAIGPPRKSLTEDLLFYLSMHGNLVDMTSPKSIDIFLQKIVASHYIRQFDYERKNIMSIQKTMRRQSHFANFELSLVEAQWSDIQSMERRLSQHCLELEDMLIQLRIPLDAPNPSILSDWRDARVDFQFLYQRFLYLRGWVERLNSSITALASIVGNRQAFKEQRLTLRATERSRVLTFMGLIFIPLAFTSSLFSMAEPYGPGNDRFWVYPAIAFPMTGLVIICYYVLDCTCSKNSSMASAVDFISFVWEKRKVGFYGDDAA